MPENFTFVVYELIYAVYNVLWGCFRAARPGGLPRRDAVIHILNIGGRL